MGGSGSKTEMSGFDAFKDERDQFYGDYRILHNDKQGSEFDALIVINYPLPDSTYASRLEALLDRRKQLSDGKNLKLVKHQQLSNKIYQGYWEFPAYTLEKEIKERKASSHSFVKSIEYFNDSEVWALIRGITKSSIKFCTKMSRYHGDIQPRFVMINKNGELFLNDILTFLPSTETGYLRSLKEKKTKNYFTILSPEALDNRDKGLENPNYDQNKNEVFAIAITVMCAICDVKPTEEGPKKFYTIDHSRVDWDTIDSAFLLLENQGRSKDLLDVLRLMLNRTEAERPTLFQVLEYLRIIAA